MAFVGEHKVDKLVTGAQSINCTKLICKKNNLINFTLAPYKQYFSAACNCNM